MLSPQAVSELQTAWLPNLTESALKRLIELVERRHPFLIQGNWAAAHAMGCLATHAAWNDSRTADRHADAGYVWLSNVAGVTPERSHVVQEWDAACGNDWNLRSQLLAFLRQELSRRSQEVAQHEHIR